jgi:flagellar L-ring protein precursor FlgH
VNKTLCLLLAFWLPGCVSFERDYDGTSAVVEKAMPILQYDDAPVTGSIYRDQARSSKFGFLRNFSLGDILTVVLNESTQAQRSNGLNTSKEVSNSPFSQLAAAFGAALPIGGGSRTSTDKEILVKRGLKALDYTNQKRSDKGVGSSDQAGSLNGALAVIVTRILPNGTLFVKKTCCSARGGKKSMLAGSLCQLTFSLTIQCFPQESLKPTSRIKDVVTWQT